jgi:hypothetical protein
LKTDTVYLTKTKKYKIMSLFDQIAQTANPKNMQVNGKVYPMWGQFVAKKEQFIGGILQDSGDSMDRRMGLPAGETVITDIALRPNGVDSAFFEVVGKDFTCGFDVGHGGVTAGEEGWITFSGYGGHTWRIKEKSN